MVPSRIEVLKLYKELLRYGEMLVFTDKNYYKDRIKKEFLENKNATPEDLQFLYETRGKHIDRSLVPKLKECDLEEKFIKGEGPGGQNVNKRNSCVYLVHKPTGLAVKVGDSREQYVNRKLAREKMVTLLDNLINKEKSVENQKMLISEEKYKKKIQKQKKLNEKKKQWKEIMAGYSKADE